MATYKVTLIPGDGIGPEVSEATKAVLEATGLARVQRLVDCGEDPGCILRGKVLRHDRQRAVEAVRGAAVKILELRRPGDLMRAQVPGPDPDLAGVECSSKGFEIRKRGGRLLGNASVRVFAVAFGFSHFHTAVQWFYLLLQRRVPALGDRARHCGEMRGPRMRVLPPGRF